MEKNITFFSLKYYNSSLDLYLALYGLNDIKEINDEIKSSYRINGISHLFAICGIELKKPHKIRLLKD